MQDFSNYQIDSQLSVESPIDKSLRQPTATQIELFS
jgi:hypothetical protein